MCEGCQHTKADHVGQCCLLHPLLLPSRRGCIILADWLLGIPVTASGFDQVHVNVDHLSSKIYA